MKWLVVTLAFGMNVNAATNAVFTKQVNAIAPEAAILASANGETVYKCQPVEMKVSKSGTSISMRNIKKKLTSEEAAQKIKEIESQRDQ
jgi:hypothetical protein